MGGGHGSRHPPRHLPVTSCTRCKGGCKTQPLLLPLLGLCEEETADNQGSGGVTCAVSCPDEMAAFFFLRGGGAEKRAFGEGIGILLLGLSSMVAGDGVAIGPVAAWHRDYCS